MTRKPWIAVEGAVATTLVGLSLLLEPGSFSPNAYQYTFQTFSRRSWGFTFVAVSIMFIGGILAPHWRARHFTQKLLVAVLAGALIAMIAAWGLYLLLAKFDPAGYPISWVGVIWPTFSAAAIATSWSRFGWGRP